jgi:hypothetical protein
MLFSLPPLGLRELKKNWRLSRYKLLIIGNTVHHPFSPFFLLFTNLKIVFLKFVMEINQLQLLPILLQFRRDASFSTSTNHFSHISAI